MEKENNRKEKGCDRHDGKRALPELLTPLHPANAGG
jgi:hypothetical protein